MRFRFGLFLVLLAGVFATAHAQVGVYANFIGQRVDSSQRNIGNTSGHLSDSVWMFGPQFGFYYDFLHGGPLHVGADFRGAILAGNGARFNNGMAGLRASIHTHVLPLTPYVQAHMGLGGFDYGRHQDMTKMLEYEVSGGVDTVIIPRVDWKLIEIGGGGLSTMGGTGGASGTFHISTGVAIRF